VTESEKNTAVSVVPWDAFCAYRDGHAKFADGWLLTPGNVVSTFRDGSRYCRLCGSILEDSPATHVAAHEPELHAWREEQRSNGRPAESELEAKLAGALELVERGVSQREAAASVGISRDRLRRALRAAPERVEVAQARTRVIPHVQGAPRSDGAPSRSHGRETDAVGANGYAEKQQELAVR
jgi:predicted DNA-binding protein (UPF0251 family)